MVILQLSMSLPARAESGSGQSSTRDVDPFFGSFSTAVPIEVPAFHGIEPKLGLTYNSRGRNGALGVGWTLKGLSLVERVSSGKGTPYYDSSDVFLLDGKELVADTSLGGTHSTKIQSYHRIKYDSSADQWLVWAKNGTKRTYSQRYSVAGFGTWRWYLRKVEDTRGNAVLYNYAWDSGGAYYYLDSVTYNGTVVKFYRESRSDRVSEPTGPGLAKMLYRIKTVEVTFDGVRSRAYKLSYTTSSVTSRSLLAIVRGYGKDAAISDGTVTGGTALPATTFSYDDDALTLPAAPGGIPGGPFFSGTRDDSVANDGYTNVGLRTADLNGDGREDLIWSLWECSDNYTTGCEAHRQSWLRTENGWTAGPTPPADAYFAMHRGGSTGSGGWTDGGLRIGDINGDGKADLLWALWECNSNYGDGCAAHRGTWLGTGSSFVAGPAMPTYPFFAVERGGSAPDDGYTDGGLRIADINGDGKSDLLFSLHECSDNYGAGCASHRQTWLSTGSAFVNGPAMPEGDPNDPFFAMHRGGSTAAGGWTDGGLRIADINGDRKADLLWSLWECNSNYGDGCEAHQRIWYGTGTSFIAAYSFPTNAFFAVERWGSDPDAGYTDGGLRIADINGDGNSDLLWSLHECDEGWGTGCADHRGTWLSLGATFVSGPAMPTGTTGIPYFAMQRPDSSDNAGFTNGGLRTADINGDGKADLLWSLWECDAIYGDGCTAHRQTWLSTGSSFVNGPAMPEGNPGDPFFALPRSGSTVEGPYTDGGLRIADINGDGKDDLLWALWECDNNYGTGCASHLGAWTFDGGIDAVTTVGNTLGGSATVAYAPSSVWENTNTPPIVQTVTSLTTSDGRTDPSTTTFEYAGGLYDRLERRFLGFHWVKKTLPCNEGVALCSFDELTFHQDYGSVSKPEEVTRYEGYGIIPFSSQTFEYTTNGSTIPYTSLLTGEYSWEYNGPAEFERRYVTHSYDAYGSEIETIDYGDFESSGDELTTRTVYRPNATDYIVGLPAVVDTYEGVGQSGALLAQVLYAYDGAGTWDQAPVDGLVTRTMHWLDTTDSYATTQQSYDAWGNLVSVTDPVGAVTTAEYDEHHRVVSETNALGHTPTTTWNDVCGQPATVTDANGQVSSFEYDALCRKTRTDAPGGDYLIESYVSWGNPNAQYTEEKTPGPDGGSDIWTRQYVDGLGRAYMTVRLASPTYILTETEYNARGQVKRVSAPHYATESSQWTSYAYDDLDRVLSGTHPDGTQWNTSYGAWILRNQDELGHTTERGYDSGGRVVLLREWHDGMAIETEYVYDARGQLSAVTDAMGNTWGRIYDSMGQLIEESDPDMGTWYYEYDAAGRRTALTDAIGQRTELGYDLLGRMVRRTALAGTEDAVTTYWSYDEAGAGYFNVGQITTLTDSVGQLRRDYDAAGRVAKVVRTLDGEGTCNSCDVTDCGLCGNTCNTCEITDCGICGKVKGVCQTCEVTACDQCGGTCNTCGITDCGVCGQASASFTFEQTYDAGGRLTSETDPDQNTLTYTYDLGGRLAAVPGVIASISYTAWGTVSNITYANGTVTSIGYSSQRQWMTSMVTQGAMTLQSMVYSRNAAGMITAIESPFAGEDRSYSYDDLNRLTSVSNGTESESFEYDAIGNITYSSRLGELVYPGPGQARPHAALVAGGENYTYDANGNLLSGGGRSLTYDGENQPISINDATFVYSGAGKRLKKIENGITTLYPAPGYMLRDGVATKYVNVGGRVVAKITDGVTYYLHTDHLGSVQSITDTSRNELQRRGYWGYGEIFNETGSHVEPMGYVGKHLDDTGLVRMGVRYYDPALGRFITPDPARLMGDRGMSVDLNRYAYANNDPVNWRDPSGKSSIEDIWEDAVSDNPMTQMLATMTLYAYYNYSDEGIYALSSAGLRSGSMNAVTSAVLRTGGGGGDSSAGSSSPNSRSSRSAVTIGFHTSQRHFGLGTTGFFSETGVFSGLMSSKAASFGAAVHEAYCSLHQLGTFATVATTFMAVVASFRFALGLVSQAEVDSVERTTRFDDALNDSMTQGLNDAVNGAFGLAPEMNHTKSYMDGLVESMTPALEMNTSLTEDVYAPFEGRYLFSEGGGADTGSCGCMGDCISSCGGSYGGGSEGSGVSGSVGGGGDVGGDGNCGA